GAPCRGPGRSGQAASAPSALLAAETNDLAIESPTPPSGTSRGTGSAVSSSSSISVASSSLTRQVTSKGGSEESALTFLSATRRFGSTSTDIVRLKSLSKPATSTWSSARTVVSWPLASRSSASTSRTPSGYQSG